MPLRRGTKQRVYKLVDYNNDVVKASWYPENINKITDNKYRIENVLIKCTVSDVTKNLIVRWEGLPDKYNLWMNDINNYDVFGE